MNIHKDIVNNWLVVFAANLFMFYSLFQTNLLNALGGDLIRSFSLSALHLGLLSSIFFYTSAICLLPAGVLLDRFSTRRIILISMSLSIAGTVLFATTNSIYVAALARFITGACNAFAFISCVQVANDWLPGKRIALAVGITVAVGMLAGMLAQAPFSLLVQMLGWRHAVLIIAVIGFMFLILIAKFVCDQPKAKQNSRVGRFWPSVWLAITNKNNWLAGIYSGMITIPASLFAITWGILYLHNARLISDSNAAIATTLIFFGIVCGSPIIGWLSDRYNKKYIMLIGVLATLLAVIPIIWLPHLSLAFILLLFLIYGILSGLQSVSFAYIAEENATGNISTAMSIGMALFFTIIATMLPLFGLLIKHNWFNWLLPYKHLSHIFIHYQNGLILMLIAVIICFLMALMIKPKNGG